MPDLMWEQSAGAWDYHGRCACGAVNRFRLVYGRVARKVRTRSAKRKRFAVVCTRCWREMTVKTGSM